MNRSSWLFAIALLLASVGVRAEEPVEKKTTAEQLEFFEARIRPVLVQRCYRCHSATALAKGELEGELQLDTRVGIRKVRKTGAAVVPGDIKLSKLIEAIRHESLKMPPDTKLRA
ncbi:MAG: c-type cytochrome domain-containing protein, partial [Pirellulaceae bacterium]